MLTPLVVYLLVAAPQAAPDAKSLQVSEPQLVGTIDTGKLKGEPTQLAWSPDGSTFCLQTSERDEQAMIKNPRYFLLDQAAKPQPSSGAPDWAAEYWRWKADKSAPGADSFSIDVKREDKTATTTAAPMGGSLARGGATGDPNIGTTAEDVATRAIQMQRLQVITLTLRNEIVGEFVNQQFIPGYTFGWAPRGESVPMIAYRTTTGRLGIMDERGRKQEVNATRDVVLPAWSPDGSKIAFLQKTGKNKYSLSVVTLK